MDVLFSLVAIALAISLYDYFTVKNWQQTTSDTRNDIVFDKRNKAYGAYVIRRDYNREMAFILLGIVLSITTAYGSFLFFQSDTITLDSKKFFDDPIEYDYFPPTTKIDISKIDHPIDKVKVDMVKSGDLVIIDDPSKGKKVDFLDDDKIQGPIDQTGKGKEGFVIPSGGGKDGGTGLVDPQIKIEAPTFDPDISAQFPGGRDKMIRFLTSNLNYPELPRQLGIEGKCHLQFVINKKGEISQIRIMRAVPDCVECDQEAVRVIKKMPKWTPAIKDGQNVDSYFIMPINFSLR